MLDILCACVQHIPSVEDVLRMSAQSTECTNSQCFSEAWHDIPLIRRQVSDDLVLAIPFLLAASIVIMRGGVALKLRSSHLTHSQ